MIFISGLGSHRLSVKKMQKARLSSYWRYTILNKSRCSPDQAKAYDENGMYIGIQRHAPYISVPTIHPGSSVWCCSYFCRTLNKGFKTVIILKTIYKWQSLYQLDTQMCKVSSGLIRPT